MEIINVTSIKHKLYERLMPSGWAPVLEDFILGPPMDRVLEHLATESAAGLRFTPPLKKVFGAFEACPWKKLDVIMVAQDPYPGPGVADGLAFSCSGAPKPEAALSMIHTAVQETVYPGQEYVPPLDLSGWASQGVLLLNTALTTQVGITGSHQDLWKEFTRFTLSRISQRHFAGLLFVFLGKQAAPWADLIDPNHFTFFVSHPASGRYTLNRKWDPRNIFNEINRIRTLIGLPAITW